MTSHIDLNAANKHNVTVAEVTGSNVVSVAEHVMMSILLLVRNFVPAHDQARSGQWNVADIARNTFDLEDKVVGTVGCGRIGYRVLQRLQPFGCKELLWYDYTDLPEGASLTLIPKMTKLNIRGQKGYHCPTSRESRRDGRSV
jgi:formate dehydrogenase